LQHKDLIKRSWKDPGDIHYTVKEFVQGIDFSVANLENPLFGDERTRNREMLALRASPKTIPLLKALKVGAVSLANNHIMDYGAESGLATIRLLEEKDIKWFGCGYAGSEGNPAILERNGVSLACFGYSQPPYEVKLEKWHSSLDFFASARYSRADLESLIPNLKKKIDYVFVFMHWGMEDVNYPVPDDIKTGREIIDLGADAVIGSHPHVYQGYEIYKGKHILYSLGNFIFGDIIAKIGDQTFIRKQSLRNRIGMVPVFSVDKSGIQLDEMNLFYFGRDCTVVKLTGLRAWLNYFYLGRLSSKLKLNLDDYGRWWRRNIKRFVLLRLLERTALKGSDFRPGKRHIGKLKELLGQDVDTFG